jgi:single-strand DNA-binding protein
MPTTVAPAGTNLALLVGTLSRPPELRPLPSGEVVLALELTVRPATGPAETVPVAWYAPAPGAADWTAGEELLVVGRTRRRFFRSGGGTQSRTEVVPAAVVPTRRAAAARRALSAALDPWCAAATGDPR